MTGKQSDRKIAVVGAGYWGRNVVRCFDQLGSLAAICESDTERHQSLISQYPDCAIHSSMTDALANCSAVAIATPAETHGKLVRQALLQDKDVLVEKPLCLSSSEGEQLVALAQERGRILMVGHLLWYHPAVLKLKELIEAGEMGRIEYIYSNRLNLGKIRREEDILWSFAPHDISVILGLLNEMPDSVQCQGGNYLHERIADVTVSNLSFLSGVRAHVFVSWLHPFKEQKLVVVGDRQMAVFDDVEPERKLLLYPHSVVWKDQLPVATKADAVAVPFEMDEPLRLECSHFLECLQTRQRPRTDGEEGLRVLRVLQHCQQALETGSRSQVESQHEAGSARPRTTFFAHESAFIDDGVEIGDGTQVWHVSHLMQGSRIGQDCKIGHNVVVGPNAVVGNGVKIQNNVCVYEGVTLEDHVFVGPAAVFTNVFNPRSEVLRMDEARPTLVRRGASLGANCTIVCGVTIGQYAFVGAGAVVTKDVPDYALVTGMPARVNGWMCQCGERLKFRHSEATCDCGTHYVREGDRVVPQADEVVNEERG